MKRREFLNLAVTASAPLLVPRSALGLGDRPAPSGRITLGSIGVGSMGVANLNRFLTESDCQVLAVCDVDRNHLEHARQRVNNHYGNSDCATYTDFRQLLARDDIDAVCLSLPDHWHALPAITAVKAGKDVYGEKPLAHTLQESRAIVQATRRYRRIWQTGSWQRSHGYYRQACELVRNGRLGKVHTVEVGLGSGQNDLNGRGHLRQPIAPPPELDYEMWLGPAPWLPYVPARHHISWRNHLDYGGGQLLDVVGHNNDIAHWGLGLDETGPVEVEAVGEFKDDGVWNTAAEFRVISRYRGGVTILMGSDFSLGTRWIGDQGWLYVDREHLSAEPAEILKRRVASHEIQLERSTNHHRNFLDGVKARRDAITPADVAHRSATPGYLGHIAMVLGRKLRFDPESEQIVGDASASQMLGKSMRSPWRL